MAAMIVGMHVVAAACAWSVLPGGAGAALGVALMVLGLAAAWSRALLRSRVSPRAIELEGPDATLELAGGDRFPAEVDARRHVSRFAVTLPLRKPVRRTILVSRDMLDADSFRLLRLWAMWGKLPVAGKQLPA